MTVEELKQAFKAGTPITFNDTTYKCVSAIIYRRGGSRVIVQAELLDKNMNSVSIAPPDRIRPGKEDKQT